MCLSLATKAGVQAKDLLKLLQERTAKCSVPEGSKAKTTDAAKDTPVVAVSDKATPTTEATEGTTTEEKATAST